MAPCIAELMMTIVDNLLPLKENAGHKQEIMASLRAKT